MGGLCLQWQAVLVRLNHLACWPAELRPSEPLSCCPPTWPPRPAPPADFHPLVDSITYSDYYLLANDFPDYIATQVRAGVCRKRLPRSGCRAGTCIAGCLPPLLPPPPPSTPPAPDQCPPSLPRACAVSLLL